MEEKLSSLDFGTTSMDNALNTIFMNTRFENLDLNYGTYYEADGDSDEISYEKFHKLFQENLQNSRVLNSVQAYLRKQVIGKLSSNPVLKSKSLPDAEISMGDRMLFSSVHDLLKHRGYHITLSLLMSESGMERANNLIKESDMVKFIQLPSLRHHYMHVVTNKSSTSTCLLDIMYNYLLQPSIHNATMKEMSCQTDNSGPTYRDVLDRDLRHIYQNYKHTNAKNGLAANRSVEETLIDYQNDLEKQYEQKLETQFNMWKELETNKLKLEIKQSFEQEYALYREQQGREMDKLKLLLQEKEKNLDKIHRDNVQAWEKKHYEERQVLLKQIEENKRAVEMMTYQHNIEKQHLSSKELHLKDLEYKYQLRESKVMEMEKQLAQDKLSCMEVARKECRQAFALELEDLQQKKLELLAKQVHVDREKDYVDSYKQKITMYEAEIERLRKEVQSLEGAVNRQKTEEKEIAKALQLIFPNTSHGVGDMINSMINKYKDLEDENKLLADHKGLLTMLNEKDEEMSLVKENMQHNLYRWEIERSQLRRELDDSRHQLNQHKEDQLAHAGQLQSLKQIIQEKNQMIEILSRRPSLLTASPLDSSYPSGSNYTEKKTASTNYSSYTIYPTIPTSRVKRSSVEMSSEELPRAPLPAQYTPSDYPIANKERISPPAMKIKEYVDHSPDRQYSSNKPPVVRSKSSSYTTPLPTASHAHSIGANVTSNRPARSLLPASSTPSSMSSSPKSTTNAASVLNDPTPPKDYTLSIPPVGKTEEKSQEVKEIYVEQSALADVSNSSAIDNSTHWLASMLPSGKGSAAEERVQKKETERETLKAESKDSRDSAAERAEEKRLYNKLKEEEKMIQIEADRKWREEEEAERARQLKREEAEAREIERIRREKEEEEEEEKRRLADQGERERKQREAEETERKRAAQEQEAEERRQREQDEERERLRREKEEEEYRKKREAEVEIERKKREEEEADRKRKEEEDEIAAARAKVLARRKQKQGIERVMSQSDDKPVTASTVRLGGGYSEQVGNKSNSNQPTSQSAGKAMKFASSFMDDDSNDMEVHEASSDSSKGWL